MADAGPGVLRMKVLFWIGLVFAILGIAALFVPVPQTQTEGLKVGGVSLGVQTQTKQKVSPIVAAVLIFAGAGMMISGRRGK